MNEKKINQILLNQSTILSALSNKTKDMDLLVSISNRLKEIAKLLSTKEIRSLQKKTKKALSKFVKRGK